MNGEVELPDLFILDQQIPTIDGLAVSKYLKINGRTKDIPIIMISAYPEFKKKAINLGVNDFLEKPFSPKDLLRRIQRHVSQEGK